MVNDGEDVLGPWQLGRLLLTESTWLDEDEVATFYEMYQQAFSPIASLAAARHLLSHGEFAAEMADRRIWKYVAWGPGADGEQEALGLCTLTKHAEAVPWVSPEFYAARYPDHAARDAIYYQGFSLVRPGRDNLRVFNRLAEVSAYRPRADRAVMGYDVSGYNIAHFRLDQRIAAIAARHGAHDFTEVDVQTYFAMQFD